MINFSNSLNSNSLFATNQTESDKSKDSENQFLDLLVSATVIAPPAIQQIQVVEEKAHEEVATLDGENEAEAMQLEATAATVTTNFVNAPDNFLSQQYTFGAQSLDRLTSDSNLLTSGSNLLTRDSNLEKQFPNLQVISNYAAPATAQSIETLYWMDEQSNEALLGNEFKVEFVAEKAETSNQNLEISNLLSASNERVYQQQDLFQADDKTPVDSGKIKAEAFRSIEVILPENKLKESDFKNQTFELENRSDVISTKTSFNNGNSVFATRQNFLAAIKHNLSEKNSFENKEIVPAVDAASNSFTFEAENELTPTFDKQFFNDEAAVNFEKSSLSKSDFFEKLSSAGSTITSVESKNKKSTLANGFGGTDLGGHIESDNQVDVNFELEIAADNFEVEKQVAEPLLSLREKLNLSSQPQAIKIKLNPEELGEVEIRLENTASGKLSARIITETDAAQQVLNESLSRLETALENSGWQIEQLEVSFGQPKNHSNQQQQESQDEAQRRFELLQFEKLTESNDVKTKIESLKILSVRA